MSDKQTNSDFRRIVGLFQDAVAACPDLNPRTKLIAGAMLARLDREAFARTGELVTWNRVGVEALAAKTSSCTRDVERARAALHRAGVIELVARPAKGRPAQYRFRLEWLSRSVDTRPRTATPDKGVADTGVARAVERPTQIAPTPDRIAAQRLTRESARPLMTWESTWGARARA